MPWNIHVNWLNKNSFNYKDKTYIDIYKTNDKHNIY